MNLLPSPLRPHPDVISTQLEDQEYVLLNVHTRQFYTLNETGTHIWQLLEEGLEAPGIASPLLPAWNVDLEEARQHVEHFLGELYAADLLQEGAHADE